MVGRGGDGGSVCTVHLKLLGRGMRHTQGLHSNPPPAGLAPAESRGDLKLSWGPMQLEGAPTILWPLPVGPWRTS